jgi:hypothetical protein
MRSVDAETDNPLEAGQPEKVDSGWFAASEGARQSARPAPTDKDLGKESYNSVHETADLSPAQWRFLREFSNCGIIRWAAERAGIGRQTHYDWMKQEEYRVAFDAAEQDAWDMLEQSAWDQSTKGIPDLVLYKGEPVRDPEYPNADPPVYLFKRTYSPQLLMFLLRGARPEKYRDNMKLEHAGEINGGYVMVIPSDGSDLGEPA